MIDAHHHFWWTGRHAYSWPDQVGDRFARDFTPDDLRPELAPAADPAARAGARDDLGVADLLPGQVARQEHRHPADRRLGDDPGPGLGHQHVRAAQPVGHVLHEAGDGEPPAAARDQAVEVGPRPFVPPADRDDVRRVRCELHEPATIQFLTSPSPRR